MKTTESGDKASSSSSSPQAEKPKTKKRSSRTARAALFTLKMMLALLLIFSLLLLWAYKTESGTKTLFAVMENFSAGNLKVSGVKGTLDDDISLEHFSFRNASLLIDASAVRLQWHPAALWRNHLDITQLQASSLTVASLPGKDAAKLPANLSLPMTVNARKLALGRLHIATLAADGKQTETVMLSALTGSLQFQNHQFQITTALTSPWGSLDLKSGLTSLRPFKIDGNFNLHGQAIQDIPAVSLTGALAGSLQDLEIAVQAQLTEQTAKTQALRGNANTLLTPFTAPYVRQLHVDVQHLDPSAWHVAAPQADLRIQAELKSVTALSQGQASRFVVSGDVNIRNTLATSIDKHGLPVQALASKVVWDADQVTLKDLAVQLAGNDKTAGKALGNAHVSWKAQQLAADVQLAVSNIDLKQIDQRLHASNIKGQLSAQTSAQTAKDHVINLQAQLQDARASLKADASYHTEKLLLNLSKFDLQAEDSHLQGTGEISFEGKQAFKLKASLKNFDPARWVATQPGRLQADFSADGQIQPRLNVQLNLPQLQGQYAGQTVQCSLDMRWLQDQQLQVKQLDLHWGKNALNAQGNWGGTDDVLKLKLDAPDLSSLNPLLTNLQLALGGSLKAEADLRGRFNEPAGKLDASAQMLSVKRGNQQFHITQLKSTVALNSGEQGSFDGEIVASHIGGDLPSLNLNNSAEQIASTDKLEQVRLQLKGRRDAHTLTLESSFPNKQVLSLVATGGLQAAKNESAPWNWQGQLQALSLHGNPDARLQSSSPLQISSQSVRLGTLAIHSELGNLMLDELEWTPSALKTTGRISDAQVIAIANLIKPQSSVTGNLKLSAQWNLNLKEQAQGEIQLQRQSGDLRFNDPDGTGIAVALGMRELQMQMKVGGLVAGTDGENLSLNINANGSRLGQWQVRANTVLSKQNEMWKILPTAALNGQISAAIPDLQWLGPWINPGLVLKGKLNVDARLMGNMGKPRYHADLTGRELEVAFASEGLLLPNGSMDAQLEDGRLKLSNLQFSNTVSNIPRHAQLQGLDMLGRKGEFKASGEVDIGKETGSIQAQWQQFPLLQRKDRWLVVSGQANIVEANNIWSLTGKVLTDGAYFKLPKLPPPSLSSDVVVIRKSDKLAVKTAETDTAKKGLKTRVDVSFDMGSHFIFVGRGLDTGLEGSLRLRSIDGNPLQANGSIRTVKGMYEGYGQQLAIERGILNFQGPPANPGLNIRALRQGLPVEAGVEIVGTVAAPQVRLVSEPSVPDSEKLSWLVLGRGSDQLAGSDASLLMSAATAIFGGDGSRNVPRDIVQGLGFDEFSIGAAGNNSSSRLPGQTIAGSTGNTTATTDQVVSVGKRIMPGLVLSVERGLSDASGAIKLSWQLTRRISLIGRTGSESAVDVNYTFSFN
ncbi:translocation/assembly module TamB domain-containing protein [Undibacterium sp. TJN19]|uniref:translocation/assembly module TamB domain-containing protein n=1 Tax=Undibacterium sp. TJN19 TaxID=3413055 RepID=UPI003BF3B7C1